MEAIEAVLQGPAALAGQVGQSHAGLVQEAGKEAS